MSPLKKAYYINRYFGPRIIWLRAGVYLGKYLGRTRRVFRPRPWEQLELSALCQRGTPTAGPDYADFKRAKPPPFLFPLGQPPEIPTSIRGPADRQPPLAERLELLSQDRCTYFFRTPSPEPIDWHANPFDKTRSDPGRTWCDVPDYLPQQGDPRMLWEPSRAAWALDLARAPAHGLGPGSADLFWRWVDSWMKHNPPYMGFQWKCGQESTVRLMAITLGFWSLADDPATTPDRWAQFARLAWATGYRIHHHINYALSQKNNHAISEACGLILIAQLFPEFSDSPGWDAAGRRVLGQEIRRQTYDDGSYLQHSMNYQRVMLQGAMLGLRLAELADRPFDRDLYERLGRCGEFLFQMMDPETGRLPQYGPNDGAHILPLSECDFTDFRPVIQATHYLARRRRLLPAGPWDEELLWLFGRRALEAQEAPQRVPTSRAFDSGGYYTLRKDDTWAMVRCHTYRDRTSQCDQLQLDLWWRGQNILQDCGTYHYYVPGRPDLERYFKSAAAHNNIEIDGCDPLESVSRFLWFPWSRAAKRNFEPTGPRVIWFEGEHYDYDRAPWRVVHRRTVIALGSHAWMVVDDLLGDGEHQATLRWHMIDVPYEVDAARVSVNLKTPAGDAVVTVIGEPTAPQTFEVVRGRTEPGRVQGLAAPYYGELQSVPTLEVSLRCPLPQRMITVIGLGEAVVPHLVDRSADAQHWRVTIRNTAYTIRLARPLRSMERTLLECSPAPDSADSPSVDAGAQNIRRAE